MTTKNIEKTTEELELSSIPFVKKRTIQPIEKTDVVIEAEREPGQDEQIVMQRCVDNGKEYYAEIIQKIEPEEIDQQQTVAKAVLDIKYKISIGTATDQDREDLQLLTS